MDAKATVARLEKSLTRQGKRARAEQEKRYLKSDLTFLGATVPIIRREAKTFARTHPELDHGSLKALVDGLWRTKVHELRSLAIGILEARTDLLRKADAAWLIDLVGQADTWAHVDWLATKVIGTLVAREPTLGKNLGRWARDDNFWVRRTALLALHDPLMAGAGDFARFERLAIPMLTEREFFIRKAIGWILRSTAKRTPERTIGFVERHAATMSALTFREATRVLPLSEQKRLRALRDTRR